MHYRLIRNSTKELRVFSGEDGGLYFADHSAWHPENTDDGPLRLKVPEAFIWPIGASRTSLPVETTTGRGARAVVDWGVFSFVARFLGKPVLVEADGELWSLAPHAGGVTPDRIPQPYLQAR